jgi:hypothetical protein
MVIKALDQMNTVHRTGTVQYVTMCYLKNVVFSFDSI